MPRQPDFMIIGAAKSATTTLQDYLCKHPQVFMTETKEPEFFSRQEIYQQGLDWYLSLYKDAKENQICGEASTTYTRWPHTLDSAKLISEAFPKMKFIYIMRNPVDRMYSHYGHHMRTDVKMTFEDAIQPENNIYQDVSMYHMQIQRYLEYYPIDCFHFILFEDLKKNLEEELNKVQLFLGLEQTNLVQSQVVKKNTGGSEHYIRHHTTQKLRRIPVLGKCADLVPSKVRKKIFNVIRQSSLGKKLDQAYELKPMLSETRNLLLKRFDQPNQALSKLINRDLSDWNQQK